MKGDKSTNNLYSSFSPIEVQSFEVFSGDDVNWLLQYKMEKRTESTLSKNRVSSVFIQYQKHAIKRK